MSGKKSVDILIKIIIKFQGTCYGCMIRTYVT
jgi:hypothetical protein